MCVVEFQSFNMPAEELPLTLTSAANAEGSDHKQWLVTPKGRGLVRQRERSGNRTPSSGVLRITRTSDECACYSSPLWRVHSRSRDRAGVSAHVQGSTAWRSRA